MIKILCLILLTAAGVGLTALPAGFFHFVNGTAPEPLRLWLVSLKSFAVPFCLLVLSATKRPIIQFSTLLWGLWLSSLSLYLTAQIQMLAPATTFYGEIFLATVVVLSLSLTLSGAIQISALFPVRKQTPAAPSSTEIPNAKNPTPPTAK